MASKTNELDGTYDYVIVGGGTAGCVLANRLSANPKNRVLLLEAGARDNWIWYHIPVGYLFAIGNPKSDWMFETTPQAGLNGRSLPYPRGKVLGGSSAINAMINMRGHADDYNNWQQQGLPGWAWDDVLPVFKRIEDHFLGDTADHHTGGEWRIEAPRVRWDVLDRIGSAAQSVGIKPCPDFNTGASEGSCYFHVNQKRGRRWSTATGFLKPAAKRSNLRILTGVNVEKLILDGNRIKEIVFRRANDTESVSPQREVILCAGSIGTVDILHRSGIGPAAWLERVGIRPTLNLNGVGRNLQDHLQLRMIFKVSGISTLNETYHSLLGKLRMGWNYAIHRSGPLTMAPSQFGMFARSDQSVDRPDLQYHVQPLSLDRFGEPLHRFPAVTMSVCNLRPTSRGTVEPNGPDMNSQSQISPNYLATAADQTIAARSLKLTRRIMMSDSMSDLSPEEIVPGTTNVETDEELVSSAGEIGTTIFHPVGTAKMGPTSDVNAVVDERLKLRGVEGVRIADASIMPNITSGNTCTPTVMIADKAAEMILAEAQV